MRYKVHQKVKVKTPNGVVTQGFIKMANHELDDNHPFKSHNKDYLVHYNDYEGFIIELFINEEELDQFQLLEI